MGLRAGIGKIGMDAQHLAFASVLCGSLPCFHIYSWLATHAMKLPGSLGYLITLGVCLLAAAAGYLLFERYTSAPWTRDGQVQANIVGIAPRVAGPIITIPLSDNQPVKKGDLLFEIDPSTYQAVLDNASARLEVAQADLVQKNQELARQSKLFETQVVDQRDFQNAQDAFAASKAAYAAAQAEVKSAQLNLDYTKVFAPVDGYVTNMNVSPGTYVGAGEQLLALVDESSFWVAAYFKETQMRNIRPGDRARVHLMGHFLQPMDATVHSVGWGIFMENGATVGLLPQVNQTVDWVRLPNRFPVRLHIEGEPVVPLRIGLTASISIIGKDGE
jgi:multidrug resistance efflux pump